MGRRKRAWWTFVGFLLHSYLLSLWEVVLPFHDSQHMCFWWRAHAAAAAAKSLQLCPTLCDSRDGSPPGSPVPGILQARTLEWVAISFSNAWKWKVKGKSLSRVRLLATPWTAAYQAPPSVGFSRQEYTWKAHKYRMKHTECQCDKCCEEEEMQGKEHLRFKKGGQGRLIKTFWWSLKERERAMKAPVVRAF